MCLEGGGHWVTMGRQQYQSYRFLVPNFPRPWKYNPQLWSRSYLWLWTREYKTQPIFWWNYWAVPLLKAPAWQHAVQGAGWFKSQPHIWPGEVKPQPRSWWNPRTSILLEAPYWDPSVQWTWISWEDVYSVELWTYPGTTGRHEETIQCYTFQ